jgi:hypothetical protein
MTWCDRCGWRDTQCRGCEVAVAQGIAAQRDETPPAAQPEGQEPDPEGDAPNG